LRAISVYVEDTPQFHNELLILFECWRTPEISSTSDLIVFGSLGLLSVDTISHVFITHGVRHVTHTPMHGPERSYAYLNSLEYRTTEEGMSTLGEYEWLLRTDTDVFLTKRFATWFPTHDDHFCVGKGAYCHDKLTRDKLRSLSRTLGLVHAERHNLGATWYARTHHVLSVSKDALRATLAVLDSFRDSSSDQTGTWPSWFRGVATMYGGELALNHWQYQCRDADADVDDVDTGSSRHHRREVSLVCADLDFDSTSNDACSAHAHIHCWHKNEVFSKFKFQRREYVAPSPAVATTTAAAAVGETSCCDSSSLIETTKDDGDESVRDFCMRMAYAACPHMFLKEKASAV
jgi:hypothetical protein